MPAESTYPHGEVFLDPRGQGRALRLTWHHEADVVVLSLWRDRTCAGTFRLAKTDVNDFIDALVEGLARRVGRRQGAAGEPAVLPHTGAIDVTPPRPAAALPAKPGDPAHDPDGARRNHEDPAEGPGQGFVEWVMRGDEGRASA